MNQKKIHWMALAIFAASAAVGFFYFTVLRVPKVTGQARDTQAESIPQAVASIGNIALTISDSGVLVPSTTTDLRFSSSGVLVEMLTKVGDEIKSGQVLARLHVDKTQAVHAAEIASAELAVVRAQLKLEDLYTNHLIDAAQAQLAVEEAQIALEDVNAFELEQASAIMDLVDAKEAVADAQETLSILTASPSAEEIYTAYASLLFKERELAEIQTQILKIEHEIKVAPNSDIRNRLRQQLIALQARLAKQQNAVENARYRYETMDDPADASEVSVAEARLSTAQTQLSAAQQNWEEVQAGPKRSDLAMAEATLVQAQAEWERLKDGPNPDELAMARAELKQAQAKLASLQNEQLILDLVAPINGIVASINAAEGDRVSDQTILTLIDLDQPSVEVYLDENDLSLVQVGYQAEVIFEAMPDTTFNGTIVEVDPSLAQVSGASVARALVQVDSTLPSDLERLPVGLNATVTILAGQTMNAVLVPLEAIHELYSGEYIVYVVHGDELERRQVSIGLRDFTSAEILSGLSAGETVALGEVETLAGIP